MDGRTSSLVSTTGSPGPLAYLVTACLVAYGLCGPPHSVADAVRRDHTS